MTGWQSSVRAGDARLIWGDSLPPCPLVICDSEELQVLKENSNRMFASVRRGCPCYVGIPFPSKVKAP